MPGCFTVNKQAHAITSLQYDKACCFLTFPKMESKLSLFYLLSGLLGAEGHVLVDTLQPLVDGSRDKLVSAEVVSTRGLPSADVAQVIQAELNFDNEKNYLELVMNSTPPRMISCFSQGLLFVLRRHCPRTCRTLPFMKTPATWPR